jgi:adenosylhomocysteinase
MAPPGGSQTASLAGAGEERIGWAAGQMPVLARIRERFAAERPLEGVHVAICLHVTAETANLVRALRAGGATLALCAANPLSTQDDVAAALTHAGDAEVHARRGEDMDAYVAHVRAVLDGAAGRDTVTLDDGADLIATAHLRAERRPEEPWTLIGGLEETTAGLLRLRRLHDKGALRCPVIAVNEARTERALNDRHGTGQSALDGIVRATNMLLAGNTVVVVGYGWAGQGVAERARGAGAGVVVCEVDPLRALEARMAGYEVMPALEAAARGDLFITVTGSREVLGEPHFARMKDGAVLANAGHFDVELDLAALERIADGRRAVRPLVEEFRMPDGRRLNLLARGRVVNLAAAEGHPAAVMDVSFALQALSIERLLAQRDALGPGVHPVEDRVDREVARLKLAALGVRIDEPSEAQSDYTRGWASTAP